MKTTIATLIAGLCATAALAQAPAAPPVQTTTPDSSTSPEVAKAAAGHEKQAAPRKSRKAKAKAKATRKPKVDDGHASKEDTTAALAPARSAG
jgi:hypothetical protein